MDEKRVNFGDAFDVRSPVKSEGAAGAEAATAALAPGVLCMVPARLGLAQALHRALAGGGSADSCSGGACHAADPLAPADGAASGANWLKARLAAPGAPPFVVLVDGPCEAVAAWLQGGAPGGFDAALAAWAATARALLEAAAAEPQRLAVFVDARGAAADPASAAAELRSRWHEAVAGARPGIGAEIDPVTEAGVEGGESPAQAARTLQDDVWQAAAEMLTAGAVDANLLHLALLDLCRSSLQREAVPLDADAWASRLRALPPGDAQTRDALLRDLQAAAADAADAARRRALRRLHEAAVELDRAARADAAMATKVGQLDAERGLLIGQVLDTQRALARYVAELRKAEKTAGALGAGVRASRVVFSEPVESPPFRHVDAAVRGLLTPAQPRHDQLVRIVEHHGRPGIAWLHAPGEPPPLRSWQPNLQEGHRDGLLIVPSDSGSLDLLERLGTADWLTLVGVVHLLEHELGAAPLARAADWRVIAGRLRLQLRGLPRRLRYDGLVVEATSDGEGRPALRVRMRAPLMDDHLRSDIVMMWLPAGRWQRGESDAPLQVLRPDVPGLAPAFGHWPVDASGSLAPAVALPVGDGLDDETRNALWERFAAADRELTLSLLDALQGAGAFADAAAWALFGSREAMDQAATRLRADAERRRAGGRPWRKAVRLLGARLTGM